MTLANVILLTLVALNVLSFGLNTLPALRERPKQPDTRMWAVQLALFLIGCGAGITQPSLPVSFVVLSLNTVFGWAMTAWLYDKLSFRWDLGLGNNLW